MSLTFSTFNSCINFPLYFDFYEKKVTQYVKKSTTFNGPEIHVLRKLNFIELGDEYYL